MNKLTLQRNAIAFTVAVLGLEFVFDVFDLFMIFSVDRFTIAPLLLAEYPQYLNKAIHRAVR